MAQDDYVDGVPGVPEQYFVIGTCGDELAFGIDRDRNLVIAGEGSMWDFDRANSVSFAAASPWYAWKDAFEHVIIREGVTSIGRYAFYGMGNVTSVVLPDTVVSIGYDSFSSCGIKAITLPASLEVIKEGAFEGCSALTEIVIPDKVTRIERDAFWKCYYRKERHCLF